MKEMKDFSSFYNSEKQSLELLKKFRDKFIYELDLKPLMAFEIEFFLQSELAYFELPEKDSKELRQSIKDIARNHGVIIHNCIEEYGNMQFEVDLKYSDDLVQLVKDLKIIKQIIQSLAGKYKLSSNFSAKPLSNNDVGSGMHIHISLENKRGKNIFSGGEIDENIFLQNAISGILALLPETMPLFTVNDQDYKRYRAKYNLSKEEMRFKSSATNAPVNVSWGVNNRTTAVRVVSHHDEDNYRRIEHRVPSAMADPAMALVGVLIGVYYGFKNKLDLPKPVWGNAFDSQYMLESLPTNYQESLQRYYGSYVEKTITKLMG
jgi:glutamine synthetase